LKEAIVEFSGVVRSAQAAGNFLVELETGHVVLARIAGRLNKHRIRVIAGDRVTCEISPYDPRRGRIVWRRKE
jgi:translation initiation factor IF-1